MRGGRGRNLTILSFPLKRDKKVSLSSKFFPLRKDLILKRASPFNEANGHSLKLFPFEQIIIINVCIPIHVNFEKKVAHILCTINTVMQFNLTYFTIFDYM